MRPEVLEILRCPQDHTPLAMASAEVVDDVNAAIGSQRLVNRAGKLIAHSIDGGLVRSAGDVLYPIIDDIPMLLCDEAIELSQIRNESG